MAAATATNAQNVVDAARLGATNINGTARYRSMGGAFGALGGDPTCMSDNPAGMAIYRGTNLFTLTPHLGITNTTSQGSEKAKNDDSNLGVSNLAGVFSMRTPWCENLVNFTLGIGVNRKYTQHAKYNTIMDQTVGSFGDYLANQANFYLEQHPTQDPDNAFDWENFNSTAPYLSMMGYEAHAIVKDPDYRKRVMEKLWDTDSYQRMYVQERSRNDEYNISGAWNFNDRFYFGATINISDFSSTMWSEFAQDYSYDYDAETYIDYNNVFESRGSGIGFNVGMIWSPLDNWRLGLAVHSPMWITITENYNGSMESNDWGEIAPGTPVSTCWSDFEDSWKYDFSTPWEYQLSTAYILGNRGLVSLEWDMRDFRTMRYSMNDNFYVNAKYIFDEGNAGIQDFLQMQHTIKAGGEFRVSKSWSVRAGYALQTSPFTEASRRGYIYVEDNPEEGYKNEVNWSNYPDGMETNIQSVLYYSPTKPNFQTLCNQHYISCGAGWRGKNWYADASVVYHTSDYNVAAYPDDFSYCEPIKVNMNETNYDITIGYRF